VGVALGASLARWQTMTTTNGAARVAQPGPPGAPRAGLSESFLVENEPGGMDDVDVWLMSTVAMIPMAAVLMHITIYAWTGWPLAALIGGPVTAILLLIVLFVLYVKVHFNAADHASVDTYNDLCVRMHRVSGIRVSSDIDAEAADAALGSVQHYGQAFLVFRKKKGLHWVLGKGYLDLLRLVHRCEEALIMYEPIDLVISEGKKDLNRLTGSTIPHRDELTQQIRQALLAIDPSAPTYLPTATEAAPKPEPKSNHAQHQQARQTLRDVRLAVNEFRDGTKLRLLEARNNLVARMFLTALTTSVLVILLVTAAPPPHVVLTGAVLYAVGATVGLFGRLYSDRGVATIGDYGISHVRLFQTFLVSGLAGVAGVYLTVMVPIVVSNEIPRPQRDGSVTTVDRSLPAIESLYDIEQNRASVVFAALFGLAPGLLVSRLSEGIEQYKKDLRTSETVAPGSDRPA
jgi:hypothetical protein